MSYPRQQALADWLAKQFQVSQVDLQPVSGDASFRRYFRWQCPQGNLIAVDAPPAQENSAVFVDVANAYLQSGVCVPAVKAVDLEQGFMCLQDFGDTLLSHVLNADNVEALYRQALTALLPIQQVVQTATDPLPLFDQALLEREYHLFSHWLLEVHLGLSLSAQEQQLLQRTYTQLTENFFAQPQVGVHRDYHSRNLMLLSDGPIGVIDFQDAVVGPLTYDAVSLLRDCYVRWPDDLVDRVLRDWQQQHFAEHDWPTFKRWFDVTGMQRHIKASGIFARLFHRDGKAVYLGDIPRTLGYLVDVGAHYAELAEFSRWVQSRVLLSVLQRAS